MANVILPELGEGIISVEISDVVVQKGSSVSIDDILIVVETDKASMEIPSTEAGLVESVNVQKGDSISPGDNIITISTTEDTTSHEIEKLDTDSNEAIEEKPTQQKNESTPILDSPKESIILESKDSNISVSASPGVRRFARELGCDISEISGTGPKGRITKEDIQNFVKETINQYAPQKPLATTPPTPSPSTVNKPEIDFTQWGNVSVISH